MIEPRLLEPRLIAPPLGSFVLVGVASVLLVILVVLPGWLVAARLAGRHRGTVVEPILALAVGVLLIVGIGLVLVGLRAYSPVLLGLVGLGLAASGVRPALGWLRRRWVSRSRTRRADLGVLVWILAASVPWWATAVAPGYPPADRLVWTYAVIGRQLAEAGGIPSGVAEWGLMLRWLPDYLAFHLVSGASEGVLGLVPPADVLAAWRVPVAMLGLWLLFAVLRLWLRPGPAVAGTALAAGSLTFLSKFNAYKPEALGIVLGLAALWLVVAGLRSRRPAWLVVAGSLLGLDLAVHAIAATVLGLFAVGLGLAEWGRGALLAIGGASIGRPVLRLATGDPLRLGTRHPLRLGTRHPLRLLGWLACAALAGLLLSVAIGVLFQGRPLVAGEAFRPSLVDGRDPTWTFFLRSTGDFSVPEPPRPVLPLARGVTTPWEGFTVASGPGWWFVVAVAVGAFFVLSSGRRWGRTGIVGWGIAGALLGLGMALFAVRFETYVPRWTGLVRFGQYVPLLAAVGAAFALEGAATAWELVGGPVRRMARVWLVRVLAVAAAIWLIFTVSGYAARNDLRISPAGERALAELARLGRPGDVVLSNALTPGTIEFFTGLEAPLEGRQPLIEEPAVLVAANELLLRAHRFWTDPGGDEGGPGGLLGELGVRWLLVVDDPALLGAASGLGGSTGSIASIAGRAGIEIVWSEGGVAIARVGPG